MKIIWVAVAAARQHRAEKVQVLLNHVPYEERGERGEGEISGGLT